VPTALVVLTVIGFACYQGWQWIQAGQADVVSILGLVIGTIFVGYLGTLAVSLLWSLVEIIGEQFGYNTGSRAQRHPLVIKLQTEGWVMGDKPPYKGDDINP
jgi:hypothetical protein